MQSKMEIFIWKFYSNFWWWF